MTDNRDYPARPILAASAAVFKPDGTVLLGARRIGPYAGVFSLPGGLVETGETLEEAALHHGFPEAYRLFLARLRNLPSL